MNKKRYTFKDGQVTEQTGLYGLLTEGRGRKPETVTVVLLLARTTPQEVSDERGE